MIERKIEELIKKRIIDLKLIDTGNLLSSIKVSVNEDGVTIMALEYYQYLDNRFNITNYVIESEEFKELIIEESINKISNDLKDL